MRLRTGHRSLLVPALLLPHLALLHQPVMAGAPNACVRSGQSSIGILMRRVPEHQAMLIVGANGALKLRMPGGVDACGGTLSQIGAVRVEGSAGADTLTLDRRRGLNGARLHFNLSLRHGRDTLRLLGSGARDRATFVQFEGSDPWRETFRWVSVGSGNPGGVQEVVLKGRGGADVLRGGATGDSDHLVRATRIRLSARGGKGDDRVLGGNKGDSLRGASGNDFLRGGQGDDLLGGGPGIDDCDGNDGIDVEVGCEI